MTSYEIVYGRFLNSIKDFNLIDLDDHTLNEMLKDWLHKAIVRTRTSSDLTARDEIAEAFDNDLTDLDIELLAMGMTLAWLEPTLKSTELTLQFIGGKEEKYYSQANHLAELRELYDHTKVEMQKLYRDSTYIKNSYFDD